ncbi:hypothetical protein Vafri_6897 [Volvox africanus]|uniref:Uncharacterized protein n=1 Tax=Volvox africanus TaxID=51714 RepID=A0A8J4AZA1_9CHLO|nr:hypothetical protein Vafri_6897 [Volvox africanus]
MKWWLLGCFLGNQRSNTKASGRSQALETLSSLQDDAVVVTTGDIGQESTTSPQTTETASFTAGTNRLEAGLDARNRSCGTAECHAAGSAALALAGPVLQTTGSQSSPEQWEAPALRLSLDCGVGIGPSPRESPNVPLSPSSNLSFSPLPTARKSPLCLNARGSVDTAIGEVGNESAVASDANSGVLIVRGSTSTAALPGLPADITGSGSRHLVSRAFQGRASLDALLMLSALVRAADDAGLAVTGIGSTTRLERIESGDLPPGDDGHHDKPLQSRPSRSIGAATMTTTNGIRPEWCSGAAAATGPRLAQRPQRCGSRWAQLGLHGNSNGAVGSNCGDCGGGGGGSGGLAAAPTLMLGSSCENASSGALVPSRIAAAARCSGAVVAVGPIGISARGCSRDPDFTFSPPTMTGSQWQSVDNSRGQHSDMMLCHHPPANLNSQNQALGGHVADSNQILELFMRLVTNCSTVGDSDLPSSSCDRSSAGTTGTGGTACTVHGSRVLAGADAGQPPVTGIMGTGGAASGAMAVAASAAAAHRRLNAQRSLSERPRNVNGRRWDGTACAGAPVVARSPPAILAAATAAAAESQDGGSSAQLLKLHRNVVLGGSSRGGRRNSWDTLAGSSGSAVAVAAAAAAALAAAGLLRGSVGGLTTAGGGCGGGCCSNSGRTGSATRFWPTGGVLQEDSGPASMLLLGALSGGMSLGGTTSATSSLVQLPTGSGSVRDVLSRIQQQHLMSLHEGAQAATSSSSWSAQTGLASLFDAHLTAALRRNGAVRTFKRALGGPANFSHTSSAASQVTGHLLGQDGRQDTSLTLTSGLMMLNLGSTAGSSAGGGIGSGAGVSHLGAASVATAAAAAGILVSGLQPPRNRRATISSISTINSSPESAAGGGAAAVTMPQRIGVDWGMENGHGGARAVEGSGSQGLVRRRCAYQVSLISDGGASEAPTHGSHVPRQLRAYVEYVQGAPHQVHQHLQRPRLNPHHQQSREQQQQQKEGKEIPHSLTVQLGVPPSQVTLLNGSAPPAVRCANPSSGGLPGYEERGSLSLALGLAAGLHGGGTNVLLYPLAPPAAGGGDAASAGSGGDVVNGHPQAQRPSHRPPPLPPPAVEVADQPAMTMGSSSLAAGPMGATWLQPPPLPRGPRSFGRVNSDIRASQDFSRYSCETEWGALGRGVNRQDTFTFTGPESSFSHSQSQSQSRAELALRETGGGTTVSG